MMYVEEEREEEGSEHGDGVTPYIEIDVINQECANQ